MVHGPPVGDGWPGTDRVAVRISYRESIAGTRLLGRDFYSPAVLGAASPSLGISAISSEMLPVTAREGPEGVFGVTANV